MLVHQTLEEILFYAGVSDDDYSGGKETSAATSVRNIGEEGEYCCY